MRQLALVGVALALIALGVPAVGLPHGLAVACFWLGAGLLAVSPLTFDPIRRRLPVLRRGRTALVDLRLTINDSEDLSVALPSGGPGTAILCAGIESRHRDDFEHVAMNVEVPKLVGLRKCQEDGSDDPRGEVVPTGEANHYWRGELGAVSGAGWSNVTHFELAIPQPGECPLWVKVHIPGFRTVQARRVIKARRESL